MHYALSPSWKEFYLETEPEKRRALLKAQTAATDSSGSPEAADAGAFDAEAASDSLRRQLFEERYPASMQGKDAFLARCIYLLGLYRQKDAMFTSIGRDTRKTVKLFHLDHPEALSDEERSVLYWEFRNLARSYIRSVRESAPPRRFFGLIRVKEEDRPQRLCEEIWSMSRGAALYAERGIKMELYTDAFRDELLETEPSLEAYYMQLDEELLRTLP